MEQKQTILHRVRALVQDRRGMTMVTVLVAFVILLILVAMFTGVVMMTQNMMQKSDALRLETQTRMQKYYTNELTSREVTKNTHTGFVFNRVDSKGEKLAVGFSLNTSLWSYSEKSDDVTLYSFGKHKTAVANH